MPDSYDRWCLFCDFEIHPSAAAAEFPLLDDYVDAIIDYATRGEASRTYANETRVARISHARRQASIDGTPFLEMLISLGDRRGATPGFVHFANGEARDAERHAGEVNGVTAHCVIRLTEDREKRGRYRMLLEEVKGIGRTPVTRLLGAILKNIAKNRGEQYRNPDTGRMNAVRPIVEVYPRRSREMANALDRGSFLPVDLIDTNPVPAFEDNPEYEVRRHHLSVKVKPAPGRSFQQAANDLLTTARENGYGRMRLSWRLPGTKKGGSTELATDMADVGTALFAHRELIELDEPLSECMPALGDDFSTQMRALF